MVVVLFQYENYINMYGFIFVQKSLRKKSIWIADEKMLSIHGLINTASISKSYISHTFFCTQHRAKRDWPFSVYLSLMIPFLADGELIP